MLGETLQDPFFKEGLEANPEKLIKGIGLLPLKTTFLKDKITRQIKSESIWPCLSKVHGFEIHSGSTKLVETKNKIEVKPMFRNSNLGWYKVNEKGGSIAGTYIHGIFENDSWRYGYINLIRRSKNLPKLDNKTKSYKIKRDLIINNLANEFKKHLNISLLLN